MVPNLLSPHPFNAPLLPPLRFRASSLSSPRREIGLMKLKGMGLSQHCGFQWHCLILPPLLSPSPPPSSPSLHSHHPPPPHTPSTPTPCALALRWQFITHPTKDPYLTHYISAYYCPLSERLLSGQTLEERERERKSDWPISLGLCMRHFKLSANAAIKVDQRYSGW